METNEFQFTVVLTGLPDSAWNEISKACLNFNVLARGRFVKIGRYRKEADNRSIRRMEIVFRPGLQASSCAKFRMLLPPELREYASKPLVVCHDAVGTAACA